MRNWASLAIAIVALALALTTSFSPSLSQTQGGVTLDPIARYSDGTVRMDLATVFLPSRDPRLPFGTRAALFGFVSGKMRPTFTFEENQWPAVFDLWTKAKEIDSDAWHMIGVLWENGPHASQLMISAGPGIEFSVDDPTLGKLSYVLPRSEIGNFDYALRRVQSFLNFMPDPLLEDMGKAAADATKRSQEISDETKRMIEGAEKQRRYMQQMQELQLLLQPQK